jgi:hypothetical protein
VPGKLDAARRSAGAARRFAVAFSFLSGIFFLTLGAERLFPRLATAWGTPFGMATDNQTLALMGAFLAASAALTGFLCWVKRLVGEDNWRNLDDNSGNF